MADYKIVIVALTKNGSIKMCADNGREMKDQIDAISPLLYSKKLSGIKYGTLCKAYFVGVY